MNAPQPHIARFNRRCVIDAPINTLVGFDASKVYQIAIERFCGEKLEIRIVADITIQILCNSIVRFSFIPQHEECKEYKGIFDAKIIETTAPNPIIFQTEIQIV